ncbi:MAG: protein-export membrane protein SecF [Nitrospirae bacterium GWC2_57_13]|jgi:preprotein translocase subunit SecF|nr:MAG: protein-export membrane protein SecF [Nitrospirae bacterium GWC1_57_7]OGW30044.1 MAG: protein-export membrane protein SecF [Nitrospirae bacterium GWC2_57_13]OGW41918.1 MAG: protein-export membrane protein SecF [Nitrospirae bacterium GWD2_57_8]
MFEILPKTNIDFMGKKNISFAVSAVLILLGLVALIQIGRGKANLGIDFAGGTTVQLSFTNPVSIEAARSTLEKNGFLGSSIQEFTEGNKIIMKFRESEGVAERVVELFKKEFTANPFEVDSTMEIGPVIGKAIQRDALIAITLSIIAIIIYIALRFEFKFGVSAAIATMHDVLAVLGIFYLLNREFNLLIVTAVLTLAGYSLTDTVVIFDRIRENLKRRREPLAALVNASVNEVLSRSVITSVTVILVLLPLVLVGGEVLHDFALALLIGVVVGTYSSVFVASPILVVWQARKGGKLISKR